MKILLDTQAMLRILKGEGLSETASEAFLDPANELYLSAASFWEMCIKLGIGKLALAEGWEQVYDREMTVNEIVWLPITKQHCYQLLQLPYFHRDPFDRLLIAQAQWESMAVLTSDAQFHPYGVQVLW